MLPQILETDNLPKVRSMLVFLPTFLNFKQETEEIITLCNRIYCLIHSMFFWKFTGFYVLTMSCKSIDYYSSHSLTNLNSILVSNRLYS